MMCAECRKRITPREQFMAVIVKDDQGRITAAYHRHHARRAKAKARTDGAVPGLVYHEDRPGAYDVEHETSDSEEPDREQEQALQRHQDRLARDRQEEDVPDRFDDWRAPVTKTLDELLQEVEEEATGADT